METKSDHEVVDSYLCELRELLQPDQSLARTEFFESIAEHIAAARSELEPGGELALRDVLARLGDPRELATSFLEDEELDRTDEGADDSTRWRRAPMCVLVLVLLLTAGGALWWRHYQTLVAPIAQAPSLVLTASGARASIASNDGLALGNSPVWREPSGNYSIDVVVGLTNAGSYPIAIDRISAPFGNLPGAGKTKVSLSSDSYFGGGTAFRPFTLGAHETIFYSIHTPESCVPERHDSNSFFAASLVNVETSFLGYHRWIAMPIATLALQLDATCR
jgi:hypothetical protein